MIQRILFLSLVSLCLSTSWLNAQPLKNPQTIKLFREVVAKPGESTVRVRLAGKDAALGVVVSADGAELGKLSFTVQ